LGVRELQKLVQMNAKVAVDFAGDRPQDHGGGERDLVQ
jgi:hypothetical protein